MEPGLGTEIFLDPRLKHRTLVEGKKLPLERLRLDLIRSVSEGEEVPDEVMSARVEEHIDFIGRVQRLGIAEALRWMRRLDCPVL